MTLDPAIKAVLDQMAAQPMPPIEQMSPPEARELYRGMRLVTDAPDVPIGKVEDREAKGPAGPIAIRVYTPVGGGGLLPCVVFYHGGGFVIGDLETHDPLCRTLANESGCRVIAIDYRLAPEHPFPAAVDDAFAALRWIEANAAELNIDPNKIAVAGDSAGGNLAAVVCQLARDAGGPPVAFQALIYPVTQARAETDSMRDLASGYLLEKSTMDWFYDQYVGTGEADLGDPRLSPLAAADLAGLPRAIVVTAGFDPLKDEGRAYAEKLNRAGVAAVHVDYADMVHGFFTMQAITPRAKQAITEVAAAIRGALA